MKTSRYAWMLRIVLLVVACAGIAYWAATTHDELTLRLHPQQFARAPFEFDDDTGTVTAVQPEARAAGLMPGAHLRSLDGITYSGDSLWDRVTDSARPGEELAVGFTAPDGAQHMATVRFAERMPDLSTPSTHARAWQNFTIFNLLPLACMLVGYWIVFVKADEPNAWLLLMLLAFPAVIFSFPSGLSSGGWLVFREAYNQFFQNLAPLALLPFAIYFPTRWRQDVRLPWLKWVILVPGFVSFCLDLRQRYGRFFAGGNPAWLRHLVPATDWAGSAINLLCVALYFFILLDKLRAASADARRRLRVVLAGTSAGLLTLLLFYVLLPALGYRQYLLRHPWLLLLSALLFLLAPLSLAYVVLVQRAMDVRVLVRQGTRYAMARASFWFVRFAIGAIISYALLEPIIRHHDTTSHVTIRLLSFFLFINLLRFAFSRRGREWIDRRFFREAYDSEQVLNELAEEVRSYTESRPLLERVSRRVADTLHVTRIAMLLRDGQQFCVAQSVGLDEKAAASLSLPASSSTVRKLSLDRTPARLYRQDPDAWYMLAAESEKQVLDALGAELLLALPGRDSLMGIMMLGPKQSEAAYSKSDLKLLQAVAMQTGLALEVGELAHSLAAAAAQRERAVRELELAREVQERLFPQSMPSVPCGSIAGACRPAQSVGGDYYDVFPLEDGRFGLAIGDVSGKGISASLLMASLRASMRGVAYQNSDGFASFMHKVNRLICESSTNNRFVTLFFAVFDPATGSLECVNAGHNPPLLLRRLGATYEPEWLDADGPVVGILEDATYRSKRLSLRPGDVLVTYTDGVSEAMTHAEEEWGEHRLLASARRSGTVTADELVGVIMADVDAFTAGAPQHDDMTLLVLTLEPVLAPTMAPAMAPAVV